MKQDLKNIDTIIIHMAGSYEDKDYTETQLANDHELRGINRPMGYHAYIRKDGRRIKGREMNVVGAHARPENTNSLGVCYEGGIRAGGNHLDPKDAIDTRTEWQKAELLNTIYDWIKKVQEAGGKIKVIKGHNQVKGVTKPCPGFDAMKEYEWILI